MHFGFLGTEPKTDTPTCGYHWTFIIMPSYIPYMLIVFMTSVSIGYLFFIKGEGEGEGVT
jgi:hypothetical protein